MVKAGLRFVRFAGVFLMFCAAFVSPSYGQDGGGPITPGSGSTGSPNDECCPTVADISDYISQTAIHLRADNTVNGNGESTLVY